MTSIPEHIIVDILENAELSIDARLAFRNLGLRPKPVVVNEELRTSLNSMIMRRARAYASYMRMYRMYDGFTPALTLEQCNTRVSDTTTFELNVSEVEGRIQYSFRSVVIAFDGYDSVMRLRMRNTDPYDIHTGVVINHNM